MPRYRPPGQSRQSDPAYDSYQPSWPAQGPPPARNDARGDHYVAEQRNDYGPRGGFSDLRRQAGPPPPTHGYPDAPRDYRPPQSDFSFRVERPAGLQTNAHDSYRPGQGSYADRPDFPSRQHDNSRSGQGYRGRGGGYRGRAPKWQPPKAADRQLLHSDFTRQSEEMLGDSKNRATYRAIEDLSDDAEAAMDISGESGSDSAEPAAKRARLSAAAASDAQAAPKWSNPDPYDALPPPGETQRKKVDVVQLIRKSRVEAEDKSSAPQAAEFISCESDDDADDRFVGQSATQRAPSGPSAGSSTLPAPLPNTLPPRPPLQAVTNDRPKPTTAPPRGKPQPELVPSSALGSRKRTFDDEIKLPHAKLPKVTRMHSGGIVMPYWQPISSEEKCPWVTTDDHSDVKNPAHRLHKELVDFYEYVRPRDFEEKLRRQMVDKLDALVKRRWSDASVLAFGSFSSGLYLPTADMDLVICSDGFRRGGQPKYCRNKHIFSLRSYFDARNVAFPRDSFETITKAKVPLLKYCDSGTGLKVDISFENLSGIQAINTFLTWKNRYPAIPKLVATLKHFLCMRGLNEPVNGGIGGFSVICMVVHLFNQHPQIQSGSMNPEHHLGELLLEFFHYYGYSFDYWTLAIQMSLDSSAVVRKVDARTVVYRNMDRLSIIDPTNPENDIAGGSSNFGNIKSVFADTYDTLHRRMYDSTQSEARVHGYKTILSTILAGNYKSFRTQREYFERIAEQGLPDEMSNKSYWDSVMW